MFCVLKKTKLLDDSLRLPRPKMTQEVILVGSKLECQEMVEELAVLPENQSTDIIEVEIICTKWQKQKTHNSKDIHKNNGSRNISG